MNMHNTPGRSSHGHATEEDIDLLKWILLIWSKWRWILGTAVAFGVAGAVFSVTTTPVYRSEAIISPKTSSTSSRVLSRLGGLGGFVATQIEAGNTPLDRLELIGTSRTLARNLIVEHNLLPLLYPERWDAESKEWNGNPPNLDGAATYLRSGVLTFLSDRKKNSVIIGIEIHDPDLAARLVNIYLDGLNKAIRDAVREDAAKSREYLEHQMMSTGDPQIQLKIQQLIAQEIEKATLVSASAFDIIEGAWVPRGPIWPKTQQIVVIAFLLGFFLSIIGVVVREKVKDFREAVRARR